MLKIVFKDFKYLVYLNNKLFFSQSILNYKFIKNCNLKYFFYSYVIKVLSRFGLVKIIDKKFFK